MEWVSSDLLEVLPAGSRVAVATMTGSCCPVTLAHVQCFIEARRIFLGEAARPSKLEHFSETLGFLSLNSDAHVSSKMRQKKEAYISYTDRGMLVGLASRDLPWLKFSRQRESEVVHLLGRTWPTLKFVHFRMNGADDVLKYGKWAGCSLDRRSIAMGRPGATGKLLKALKKANIDLDKGAFIVGPELPDISSTEVRKACKAGDTLKLSQLLNNEVAKWCLSEGPYKPKGGAAALKNEALCTVGSGRPNISNPLPQEETLCIDDEQQPDEHDSASPICWKLELLRSISDEAREGRISDDQKGLLKDLVREGGPEDELRLVIQGMLDGSVPDVVEVESPDLPSSADVGVLGACAAVSSGPPICDIFLVRHGERADEVKGPEHDAWRTALKGKDGFDPPLTRTGRAQAMASAQMLRAKFDCNSPFDLIFTSPLQRCVCTAEAFAEVFEVPIQVVLGLGECCDALSHRNRSAEVRWKKLLPLEQLRQMCVRATFVESDPVVERFIEKGATCIGRLAQGRRRVLAVSHRESIRHLALHKAGIRQRQRTPYACIGLFHCTSPGAHDERWVYDGLVESDSSVRPTPPPYEADGDDPAAREFNVTTGPTENLTTPSSSAETRISMFELCPGTRLILGNIKHKTGKTALRRAPSDSSTFIGVSVKDGAEVIIRELNSSLAWAKIEAGSASAGWVKTRNLHIQLGDGAGASFGGSFVIADGSFVYVGCVAHSTSIPLRSKPSNQAGTNLTGAEVSNGELVQVTEVSADGDWLKVRSQNAEGWMMTLHTHIQCT